MGELHTLIENRGRQGALDVWNPRSEVDTAHAYMTDEDTGIGFLYSGFCQAALPHRSLPAGQNWHILSEHVGLLVEPGSRFDLEGIKPPEPLGVPYGSRARLIMLYLQSEALRTKNREVELGAPCGNGSERWAYHGAAKTDVLSAIRLNASAGAVSPSIYSLAQVK